MLPFLTLIIHILGRSSLLGYLNEVSGGLTSLRGAAKLLDTAEKDWPTLSARLHRMRDAIVKKGKVVVNLTGDKKMLEIVSPTIEAFINGLPAADSKKPGNSQP